MNWGKAIFFLLLAIFIPGVIVIPILLSIGALQRMMPIFIGPIVFLVILFIFRKPIAKQEAKAREKAQRILDRSDEFYEEQQPEACKREYAVFRPKLEEMGLDAEAADTLYRACKKKYGDTVPTKRQVRIVAEADKKLHFTFQDDLYWAMYQSVTKAIMQVMDEVKNKPLLWEQA